MAGHLLFKFRILLSQFLHAEKEVQGRNVFHRNRGTRGVHDLQRLFQPVVDSARQPELPVVYFISVHVPQLEQDIRSDVRYIFFVEKTRRHCKTTGISMALVRPLWDQHFLYSTETLQGESLIKLKYRAMLLRLNPFLLRCRSGAMRVEMPFLLVYCKWHLHDMPITSRHRLWRLHRNSVHSMQK